MTNTERSGGSHRILVAIDASIRGRHALETAADLAARMQAELLALFVEDVNLFELADLPFACELDRASGAIRPLNRLAVTRSLQAEVERIRSLLTAASEQRRIHTTLKVVRGHYFAAAMEAAADTDVVIITNVARVVFQLTKQGRPAVGTAKIARQEPVWVLYDGSPSSVRALEMARDLSQERATELAIVIPGANEQETHRLEEQATRSAGGTGRVTFHRVPAVSASAVCQAMARDGCLVMVLPREYSALAQRNHESLLDRLDCPLILVA